MLRRLDYIHAQFQHAMLDLYRLLKIIRDRFLEEHNVTVRGRIVCVFEVYLHVYGGRDGERVCVCACACAHSHVHVHM
jgi:hypothetical protein